LGVAEETVGTVYYPIFGGGSLPFRGHITLDNIDNVLSEYKGVKTYTVQSGMRYDHGRDKTRHLVEKIRSGTAAAEFPEMESDDRDLILKSTAILARNYLEELLEISDRVIDAAALVPNQRERLLESSDVAYYQSIRNIEAFLPFCQNADIRNKISRLNHRKLLGLPRSIRFTAALYSVGLPPELLGMGNGLVEIGKKLGQAWLDRLTDEVFPSLREDISFASRFLGDISVDEPFMTEKIRAGITALREMVHFAEPESSYISLSRVALSCLRDFWSGKNTMPERFAIMLSDGSVSEYVNPSIRENLSKLILDMGLMRGSLG
jgi:phosphoenolpyruvate carboxylase